MNQIRNHSQIGVKMKQIFELPPWYFFGTLAGGGRTVLAFTSAQRPPQARNSSRGWANKKGGIDELNNQLRDRRMMQMHQNAPFDWDNKNSGTQSQSDVVFFFFFRIC